MTAKRTTRPSASKRTKLEMASPLAISAKAVEGFRSMFVTEAAELPPECEEPRKGSGVEPPDPDGLAPNHLDRAFLFVDVSGFTAYVDTAGDHAAIDVLTRFRREARDVAARRGVRVSKWLGDGVMLVGVEPGVIVAAAGELMCRFDGSGIDIHAGLASGPVLLFEGDDYIGRPVNLAARLCDAAAAGEILAAIDPDDLPEWVRSSGQVTVNVLGVGDVSGVHQLSVDVDVLAAFKRGGAAA
jgi:class 3 adenylate cyclase